MCILFRTHHAVYFPSAVSVALHLIGVINNTNYVFLGKSRQEKELLNAWVNNALISISGSLTYCGSCAITFFLSQIPAQSLFDYFYHRCTLLLKILKWISYLQEVTVYYHRIITYYHRILTYWALVLTY